MKIGLIGSGRMAQAMGGYLKDRGYPICGIWGRDPIKTQKAADSMEIKQFQQLEALVFQADILLLAVTDDSILPVAQAIADSGLSLKGKWAGHFSGSLSLTVMDPLATAGVEVFSLHPLQTVPASEEGRRALESAVFVLEAPDDFRKALEDWLAPCGNPATGVLPGYKVIYHLGACLASNYVMTLYRLAEEALICSGIPEELASKALVPLMESTLNNYKSLGPFKGLTGPVSRGDAGTVKHHLDSLQKIGWEQREPLIRALGREALDIARKNRSLSEEKAEVMTGILKGGINP